ncbi:hypothetical protein SSP24_60190 [Streptomyces spinoverrucosus]|uniref:Uncharacterized protein n=1 Tax=Streptomyces spinoverrucosus TaxID=284043 RepID=A0A4Y3VN56_9ACTN|nr:hypothetical protein SSP24_60190 [Streptomyces spinoverrucosus]GHB84141.1 hypothetical protein GCM10010397_64280 [Streptomyces spinoverrucosus]
MAPDSLAGDRTQGSQQYSIWATCVDWHAAELLPGDGTWPPLTGFPARTGGVLHGINSRYDPSTLRK